MWVAIVRASDGNYCVVNSHPVSDENSFDPADAEGCVARTFFCESVEQVVEVISRIGPDYMLYRVNPF